ncbi:MAG: hypothetical protein AB7J28_12090 [Hyphomonadaceae bacterium]
MRAILLALLLAACATPQPAEHAAPAAPAPTREAGACVAHVAVRMTQLASGSVRVTALGPIHREEALLSNEPTQEEWLALRLAMLGAMRREVPIEPEAPDVETCIEIEADASVRYGLVTDLMTRISAQGRRITLRETVRTPFEIVHGCWIERRESETITMRWLPDRENPARFNGETLTYGAQGASNASQYWIERDGAQWRFCPWDGCAPIGETAARALPQGGIEYFEAVGNAERLELALVSRFGDEWSRYMVFQGARDGCD